MIKLFKKMSPVFLRNIARLSRSWIYSTLDKNKPFLNFTKYAGFNIFYTRGDGLISRIRFGNTDRIYESELVNKITSHLKNSSPIFLDIGTNIGLISLSILHNNPNVKIFGFEPSPIAFKCFATTIFANGLEEKITLINKAVDAKSGIIKFFTHDNTDSSGDGIIDTERARSNGSPIEVEATTIDDWWILSGKPKVDVVKIDIEGAELRALNGGVMFLKQSQPHIFLEISRANLKVYPHNEKDILSFFISNDYELLDHRNTVCTLENISYKVEESDTFLARPAKLHGK